LTVNALRWSIDHGGACSLHFKFREFASSQTGRIRTRGELASGPQTLREAQIRTHGELISGLETLREHIGGPNRRSVRLS
jgi:hypothetical protein